MEGKFVFGLKIVSNVFFFCSYSVRDIDVIPTRLIRSTLLKELDKFKDTSSELVSSKFEFS